MPAEAKPKKTILQVRDGQIMNLWLLECKSRFSLHELVQAAIERGYMVNWTAYIRDGMKSGYRIPHLLKRIYNDFSIVSKEAATHTVTTVTHSVWQHLPPPPDEPVLDDCTCLQYCNPPEACPKSGEDCNCCPACRADCNKDQLEPLE